MQSSAKSGPLRWWEVGFVAVGYEERELALEAQFDGARRAVAVFGDDELGEVGLGALRIVVAVAIEEGDDVGFLFERSANRARSASIGRFSLRELDAAIELGAARRSERRGLWRSP